MDTCTVTTCLSASAVTFIFTTAGGCWACGFVIGKAVAFTRAIRSAA